MAQGMSCRCVAHLLGDSPRTVQYWVHRFESEGLAGLVDGERPGRPTRLSDEQLDEIGLVLRKSPLAQLPRLGGFEGVFTLKSAL